MYERNSTECSMRIFLKKNEERRILAGHLWVFSNEIEDIDGQHTDYPVADLYTHGKTFLGRGFYNKKSLIAFRLITYKKEEINYDFFKEKIINANNRRLKIYPINNVYRVVNSESDFLPGLVIDRFDDFISFQISSAGMELFKEEIIKVIDEIFSPRFIIEKNNIQSRELEGLELIERTVKTSGELEKIIQIDGVKFIINLEEGQKTGFYLDQNMNRKKLRDYIRDDSEVLDLFCYEGGFALNAAYKNAKKVIGVDVSEKAIKRAIRNSELNEFNNIEFIKDDVFDFLNNYKDKSFDIVILDPPSFTKSKKNIKSALNGYIELNSKALKLLKKNSFLFTFSCSHHITEDKFLIAIGKSAIKAGREVKLIDCSKCSYDHPILPQMPETSYLKGFTLFVV
ncbi:MAG: class I SAM-dependent rRNA methyltransferase [Ignavibacteria bacterium]|nr:class I SAM-dependent rRNA methyltransferase [Ignavibacteria bacterium]